MISILGYKDEKNYANYLSFFPLIWIEVDILYYRAIIVSHVYVYVWL